ncbi:response regulator [Phormidium tenue FACHB-886]|nr:response regulator [Phormidium tenue FACHB-886]
MCRILIVDDLQDHIFWLKTHLEEQGYTVQTALGGWSALEIIKDWHPNIVLLDIILLDMLGYSVVKRIRENLDLAQPRIILITASSVLEESEAMATGADAFVRKPIYLNQLLPILNRWCAQSSDRQGELSL